MGVRFSPPALVIQNSFSAKKEIEMYKVGDKVLMEVEIVSVDKDDEWLTYEIEFDDDTYWISPKDIYSASPKLSIDEELETEDKAAEELPELKYKIGDKVQHKYKKEWGIGEIAYIESDCFVSEYTDETYNEVQDIFAPYGVTYPTYKDSIDGMPYEAGWYTAESNIELVTEEN
jgi:hypothetical protein